MQPYHFYYNKMFGHAPSLSLKRQNQKHLTKKNRIYFSFRTVSTLAIFNIRIFLKKRDLKFENAITPPSGHFRNLKIISRIFFWPLQSYIFLPQASTMSSFRDTVPCRLIWPPCTYNITDMQGVLSIDRAGQCFDREN